MSGDVLTLQSTDPSEATTSPITITIEATLDNYPAIAAVEAFEIEIIDLCDTTTLHFDPNVSAMTAYVYKAAATQTVLASDTTSTSYGTMDGVSFCGTRSYSISPTTYSFLSLSSDKLTLQSTNPADATTNPIIITISATLDNYSAIPASVESFEIEIIDLCRSATIAQTDQAPNSSNTYTGPITFQA